MVSRFNLRRASRLPSAGPKASRWLDSRPRKAVDSESLALPWDTLLQAAIARVTRGASPVPMTAASLDWAMHLTISPGKLIELAGTGTHQWQRLFTFAHDVANPDCKTCIEPYRRQDNHIDGVVITFVDVTAAKLLGATLRDALADLQGRFAGQSGERAVASTLEGILQKAQAVLTRQPVEPPVDGRQPTAEILARRGRP